MIYLQLFILALSLAVLLAEYVRAIQRSNAVGDEEVCLYREHVHMAEEEWVRKNACHPVPPEPA